MNAHNHIGSARTWDERVSDAKLSLEHGNKWLVRFHIGRIHFEADRHGDADWAAAAQYALDCFEEDDFSELAWQDLNDLVASDAEGERYDDYVRRFPEHIDPPCIDDWRAARSSYGMGA